MSSTGLLPTRVADPFKKGMGTHVRGVSIFILHFELRLIASLLQRQFCCRVFDRAAPGRRIASVEKRRLLWIPAIYLRKEENSERKFHFVRTHLRHRRATCRPEPTWRNLH